jgi:hypothetical protein
VARNAGQALILIGVSLCCLLPLYGKPRRLPSSIVNHTSMELAGSALVAGRPRHRCAPLRGPCGQIGSRANDRFRFNEFVIRKSEIILDSSGESVALIRPARAHQRGRYAIVTERWRGLRWTLWHQRDASRADETSAAYGEVVWSWRRAPGVCPRRPVVAWQR